MTVDIAALTLVAEHAIRRVGVRLRDWDVATLELSYKGEEEVTDADRWAEGSLWNELRVARPMDGVYGEEGARADGELVWHIDPIDGTTNKRRGLTGWTVAATAVDAEGPLVGWIFDPELDQMFSAARGEGVHLNGKLVSIARPVDLAMALVAFNLDATREFRRHRGEAIGALIGEAKDVRRSGGSLKDVAGMCAGRLDAVTLTLGKHELPTAKLFLAEAGAAWNAEPIYDESEHLVAATSQSLHDDLVRVFSS